MGPKNNLQDVLSRRVSTPTLTSSSGPSTKADSNKFKPAIDPIRNISEILSKAGTENLLARPSRQSLPTFSTPGFGKTKPNPPRYIPSSKTIETIDLSVDSSSIDSNSDAPGTKRSSPFTDSVSKRTKTEHSSANKENLSPVVVSKLKLDVKGKSRLSSPVDEIIDDEDENTKPQDVERQTDTEFQYFDPFAQLDQDFPQYCNLAKAGPEKPQEPSKYPDLLLKSLSSLRSLLSFNIRLHSNNQQEIDKYREAVVQDQVDIYTLEACQLILSERISALKALINEKSINGSTSEPVRSHYFSEDTSLVAASTVSSHPPSTIVIDDDVDSDDLWEGMDDIPAEFEDSFDDLPEDVSVVPSETAPGPIPDKILKGPYYQELVQNLQKMFQLTGFRKNQLEAIHETMGGRDVFVLMPTGGGKSLCYQLPAVCQSGSTRGTTIVVSPLLALMQNQVAGLKAKHVDVLLWNSETADVGEIFKRLRGFPKPSLMYVTPEKLRESNSLKNILRELYNGGHLARFVIDEAHCISTWGKDFREAYQGLGTLRDEYPKVPIMALTATANKMTVDDIMNRLKLQNCASFTQSFNRTNLNYVINAKKKSLIDDIVKFIKDRHPNKTGVIYCLGRDKCESVAKLLRDKGLNAKHFHAKLDPSDKERIQMEWQSGAVHIIVATIAFGMGIDKPDVRYVIHHDLPKSLDGYYQETGRAGRDGKPADCVLYYSYRDFEVLRKMIRKEKDTPRDSIERQEQDARAVVTYCENDSDCRRVQLLQFFGEKFDKRLCNRRCDNCRNQDVLIEHDLTKEAGDAVALVRSFTSHVTVDQCRLVLKGSKSANVLNKGHDKLRLYGAASHLSMEVIELLFAKLLFLDALAEESIANASGWHNQYVKLGRNALQYSSGSKELKLRYKPKAARGGEESRAPRRTKKGKTTI